MSGVKTNNRDEKAVDLVTGDKNEDEEKDKKPRHPIFDAISKSAEDDVDAVRKYIDMKASEGGVDSIDLQDDSGMTLLMHAAWKGKLKVAKFLIAEGADVNGGDHDHDYTALHFAALAGKEELCKLLVQNGAKTDAVNSVKRTPTAMAAFVGNHNCVAVINNFVPKESVYFFTRKQPLEEKAKLDPALARPIHSLVMSMNTHPVRIALIMKSEPLLLENAAKVVQILELMSDREFTNRRDVNEVLSLKYHMIRYIVRDIQKQMKKDSESGGEKKVPFIDRWIKSMLVGRESDGYPVFQEDFLRQGIKEFPFKESQLLKMLVTNFSHCKNYGEGVTAAEYINQAFNGQKGFRDGNCEACCEDNATKKCSSCKCVQYCSQECQKLHWFVHKKHCQRLKEGRQKMEASQPKQQEAKPDS